MCLWQPPSQVQAQTYLKTVSVKPVPHYSESRHCRSSCSVRSNSDRRSTSRPRVVSHRAVYDNARARMFTPARPYVCARVCPRARLRAPAIIASTPRIRGRMSESSKRLGECPKRGSKVSESFVSKSKSKVWAIGENYALQANRQRQKKTLDIPIFYVIFQSELKVLTVPPIMRIGFDTHNNAGRLAVLR